MRTATIQTRAQDDRDHATNNRITRWRELAAEARRIRATVDINSDASWDAYRHAYAVANEAWKAI